MPPLADENPYRPPQAPGVPVLVADDRWRALWRIRWALLILAVPGGINYVCLHFLGVPQRSFTLPSPQLQMTVAAVNFVASVLTLVGTWCFGLLAFECAAVVAHHVFGGRLTKEEWLTAMYRALWRLPWAAAAGSILWSVWCYLFFIDRRFPVLALNLILGGLGHLVAAWVYVNVLLSWYRVRRAATQPFGAAS
jgi:hypothetical protein